MCLTKNVHDRVVIYRYDLFEAGCCNDAGSRSANLLQLKHIHERLGCKSASVMERYAFF